ncbi:ABC transporter ATP-binding protein [Nakamurella endophytica]|uniref:Dipeptide/oligopeptide/nickel ABC transporter ATP-binding protein n=1 Tax=Nakamurella endophytica TaxID=1748367 RepID=A0A917WEA9_9ACTN|nr:ABC transporter ATP-binding protein [Nakamurella endophytica]GGL97569.1 dipeptide/oligopeptide/nickel ABC transporter ATP-binding protein [Nakamurella endophytica]
MTALGTTVDSAVTPVLRARGLTKNFTLRGGLFGRRRTLNAVDDVDLDLFAGQVTAIIGESGSGKSTVARLLAQLQRPTAGSIELDGAPVSVRGNKELRRYVARVQLILQDPFASFNPVHTMGYQLRRAVRIHSPELTPHQVEERVGQVLAEVNLTPARQYVDRYPHELSGGQRQRLSIARALTASPSVILADEPVSMLDVSIRLGVLNLLARLAAERNIALLYITHDIASARYFAEVAAVMYAGELVEGGSAEEITQHPTHPYTRLLISAAPDPDRPAASGPLRDAGAPPNLADPPTGCRFHPRCPFVMDKCRTTPPPVFPTGQAHWSRCWLHETPAGTARLAATPLNDPDPAVAGPAVQAPAPTGAQHTQTSQASPTLPSDGKKGLRS